MIGLRIWIAVGANVAVAGISLTGSAWLWTRAAEPTVRPQAVPTLPAIVGETSVPFTSKAGAVERRANRRAEARRAQKAERRRASARAARRRPAIVHRTTRRATPKQAPRPLSTQR
jgi:hypothetical protein